MVNALREELTGKENTLEEMKKALKEVSAFVIAIFKKMFCSTSSVLNERRRPSRVQLRSIKNEASRYKDIWLVECGKIIIRQAISFISVAPAPNFEIAATTVEPASKACLKLHADEAIGRMQWKMTH